MATIGDTVLYRLRPIPGDVEAWRPALVLRVADEVADSHDLGVFMTLDDRRRRRCPSCMGTRMDPRSAEAGPIVVPAVLPGVDVGQWKVKV